MLEEFSQLLAVPFFQRALIVGFLVSLCASLLGVSLVLKRYSMIGTGLSNVGFGCATVALAFNIAPMWVSVPVVMLAAFLLLRISESSKINGDSAIAMISSAAVAIGVIAVYVTSGVSTDVCGYMFGSMFTLTKTDAVFSTVLSVIVAVMFVLFYNRIFAVTFDESFARATGTRAGMYNTVIALLTAATIVLGMKMMGTMLISSLIIFPALSSMRLCRSFKSVIVLSAIISTLCFLMGMFVSYKLETPAGAGIVAVNVAVFLIMTALSKIIFRNRKA